MSQSDREAPFPVGQAPMLDRRQFGRIVSAGLLGIMGAGAAGVSAKAATPRRGGRVRAAMSSESTNDTFDGVKFVITNDYFRGSTFYNTLTGLDGNAEAIPQLAKSFTPNADATQWVFELESGVRFHDGSPLLPEDIAYSILRHRAEGSVSSMKALISHIDSISADGRSKVVVKLREPDVDLPLLLASGPFNIVKDGTTNFSTVNGTGPFRLKEFVPGVRTVGVRNNEYWREGRPYLDEIEFISITDPIARVNALLAGDVDMIVNVAGAGIDRVTTSSNAELLTTPCPRYTDISMRMDVAPSSSQDLRLALAHAMDRERFVNVVLKGHGKVGNDHPFLPGSTFYNADIPQRAADLDRAKFHFARSGIGTSAIPITVTDAAPFSVDLGLILQRQAASIGMNVQLDRVPIDSYWNNVWGTRPLSVGTINPRPTYNIVSGIVLKTGANWNKARFSNARVDKLIDETRSTLDLAKRKEMYGEIQKIVNEATPTLLPAFAFYVDGMSKKVKGLTPVPIGNLGGFNFADRVWLES